MGGAINYSAFLMIKRLVDVDKAAIEWFNTSEVSIQDLDVGGKNAGNILA